MAGRSLEEVLCSGVRGDMDKALALLAKRSSTTPSGQGASSSKTTKTSDVPKTVNDLVSEPAVEVADEGAGLIARSGKRGRDGEDDGPPRAVLRKTLDPTRFGPGKSLTITGLRKGPLPPALQGPGSVSPLRIEVHPNEKWSAGSKFPVQVFKAFNLPQDFTSYVDKSRDEIAERCLARGGRVIFIFALYILILFYICFFFLLVATSSVYATLYEFLCFLQFLADIAHIVTDYRADVDRQWREGSTRELDELKKDKAAVERRVDELEKQEVERAVELKELKLDNEKLKEVVDSGSKELSELRERAASRDKELEAARSELSILKGANEVFEKTINDLRLDLERSVADLAQGIGAGYQGCYDRLKGSGIDLTGHSFDDYCADLAKGLPSDDHVGDPGN